MEEDIPVNVDYNQIQLEINERNQSAMSDEEEPVS